MVLQAENYTNPFWPVFKVFLMFMVQMSSIKDAWLPVIFHAFNPDKKYRENETFSLHILHLKMGSS